MALNHSITDAVLLSWFSVEDCFADSANLGFGGVD